MPCPYFFPERLLESQTWLVPPRFPLGAAYAGTCQAIADAPFTPALDHQERICNFGYAAAFPSSCERCPSESHADAVRFARMPQQGRRKRSDLVQIVYIFEKNHAPVEHGVLEYSRRGATFGPHRCSPAVLAQARTFLAQLPS